KNTLPTIIDIEASGFGAASYPIEIGIVRYDGAKWCKLLRPFDSWVHWDRKAESLHGITQQMLQTRGEDPRKVCIELNHLLGNTVVYSDGWVVDNPWLIKLYAAAQIEMSFTCRALEYILSEAQMNQWHDVKNRLARQLDVKRHRASSDALVIQQTYAKTQSQ
ncbi:MAG: exonuclease domain-containing protein, partial [Pseudomonadota bacterium]|nr:exonuclease domain-containing protein [Pseudomonadota bacterium]